MRREHDGQGTLDEEVPATGRQQQLGEQSLYTRVKEGARRLARHDENHTPMSANSLNSSPDTTPDLEKAASNANDLNQAQLEPHIVSSSIKPDKHASGDNDPSKVEAAYPEGGLAAWLVVFGSFSGMTAGFGLMNTVGTYQAYLSTHQLSTSSPSLIGWIFSIYIFLAFFCGVQIGPVFDAKGPRWLVFAGSVCLVGGTFAFAESSKLWQFTLSFSILCGLGTSLIFTPAVSAIAHWFKRRRAFATGLATTGGSIGGVIFPLMLQRLFPFLGFAWAVRVQGFIFLGLCTVANLLIRSRLPPPQPAPTVKDLLPDWRIFRNNWVFILTTAGVFFLEWGLFVPLAYLSSFALDHGVNPTFAYQLLAILNGGSFFGRWGPGLVADKVGRFNTMIVTVAICLVSILAFWLTANSLPTSPSTSTPSQITPLIIVFALLFGFGSGSNISLTPVCVGQLCGTEVFGRWYAGLYTIVSFGCLTGLPIAGALVRGEGGGYGGLVGFTAGAYAGGLVCFVWARVLVVGWGVRKIY